MENGINRYPNEIPLFWLRGNQLPTSCHAGMSPSDNRELREEYSNQLPFSYLGALTNIASTSTSLSKGGRDESLFLFTFPEALSMFIMPALSVREDMFAQYSLPFDREYDVGVRFHSVQFNHTDGKRYNLIAHSWDDVRFKRTTIYHDRAVLILFAL
jgi:hypothetical protein